MTELVPATEIEELVGIARHALDHYGRADSAKQQVYILHSHACLESGIDLRNCPYSIALDEGILLEDWEGNEDKPVVLSIGTALLTPARVCTACGCSDDRACDGGCWWPTPDQDVCSTCRRSGATDWATDLTTIWEDYEEPFPFVEDENCNITGYGHQDKATFAAEINRYDQVASGRDWDPEDQWTADQISHQWAVVGEDGETLHRCEPTDPNRIAVTTLWGAR